MIQPSSLLTVLSGLGISKPFSRMNMLMSELSGGWRMRCALAEVLAQLGEAGKNGKDKIDVLLLDEATNHCK